MTSPANTRALPDGLRSGQVAAAAGVNLQTAWRAGRTGLRGLLCAALLMGAGLAGGGILVAVSGAMPMIAVALGIAVATVLLWGARRRSAGRSSGSACSRQTDRSGDAHLIPAVVDAAARLLVKRQRRRASVALRQ